MQLHRQISDDIDAEYGIEMTERSNAGSNTTTSHEMSPPSGVNAEDGTATTSGEDTTNGKELPTAGLHWAEMMMTLIFVTVIIIIVLFCVYLARRSWFDNCSLEEGWDPTPANPSACAFIDMIETPTPYLYMLLLSFPIYSLIQHSAHLETLKTHMLVYIYITTTLIRGLSGFSGWTIGRNIPVLVWASNCPAKAIWLWALMALWFWDWTYLGVYEDEYGDEAARAIRNKHGAVVWKNTPSKDGSKPDTSGEGFMNDLVPAYRKSYMPMSEITIRLGYIHIVDNLIHVIWLRYYIENGPYTLYINNSEIFTLVLLLQMAVYTYARMRTHVTFVRDADDDEEEGLGLEQWGQEVQSQQSWSEGLFTRPARQNLPREPTVDKHVRLLVMLFVVTVAMAVGGAKLKHETRSPHPQH